jgi:mRNA interferase MazF
MIDKAVTVSRSKIGGVLGHLSDDHMVGVTRSLALFLGFA